MTANDCTIISLLDTFRQRLLTKYMEVAFNSSCPRNEMHGMCSPFRFY